MRAQSQLGDDQEAAEQTLLDVLREDPEILDAHQMLGQLAVTQGRYDDALERYRRVLELEPKHKNSLMGMASSYRALGRTDEALVGFRRLLEVSGHDTRATLAIADIEFAHGNFDEAAKALDEAVETTEAPALIHNKLGEVRVEQGRSGEAMALFVKAVEEKEGFAAPPGPIQSRPARRLPGSGGPPAKALGGVHRIQPALCPGLLLPVKAHDGSEW